MMLLISHDAGDTPTVMSFVWVMMMMKMRVKNNMMTVSVLKILPMIVYTIHKMKNDHTSMAVVLQEGDGTDSSEKMIYKQIKQDQLQDAAMIAKLPWSLVPLPSQ